MRISEFQNTEILTTPREARDLIFKIRSYSARSDLKNKQKTTENTLILRSDLTVQDRILKIRSLASLGLVRKRFTRNWPKDGKKIPFVICILPCDPGCHLQQVPRPGPKSAPKALKKHSVASGALSGLGLNNPVNGGRDRKNRALFSHSPLFYPEGLRHTN